MINLNKKSYEYLKRFIDIYEHDLGVKASPDKVWTTYTILEAELVREQWLKDEQWLYENFNYYEYDNPQEIAKIEGVESE